MTDKPKDKIYITALCKLLGISIRNIKKDECGDYYVPSKYGKVFTVSPYWYIYYQGSSSMKWENVKHKLSFMFPSQDGDDEGILRADFPPSDEQAELVRRVLKLRKSYIPTYVVKTPAQEG